MQTAVLVLLVLGSENVGCGLVVVGKGGAARYRVDCDGAYYLLGLLGQGQHKGSAPIDSLAAWVLGGPTTTVILCLDPGVCFPTRLPFGVQRWQPGALPGSVGSSGLDIHIPTHFPSLLCAQG